MSWTQFAHIIDAGVGSDAEWQEAIAGNPNNPADALKVAIFNRIIDTRDVYALERLCQVVIQLARRAETDAEQEELSFPAT